MLLISNYDQGTPEWFADRLGKATGSKANAILAKAKTKSGESTVRRNYRFQLALERVTRKPVELSFTNSHIERGKELEKFARMAYEIAYGEIVEEAGFCYLEGSDFGCSVDGFTNDRRAIIEIKAPIPAIHYGYMQDGGIPSDYLPQVLHNILTTGAEYCDFISYCETMPERLQLYVHRFQPTKTELMAYKVELDIFLEEVKHLTNEILEKAQ